MAALKCRTCLCIDSTRKTENSHTSKSVCGNRFNGYLRDLPACRVGYGGGASPSVLNSFPWFDEQNSCVQWIPGHGRAPLLDCRKGAVEMRNRCECASLTSLLGRRHSTLETAIRITPKLLNVPINDLTICRSFPVWMG